MPLQLKYADRYRLWNDLLRATTDRLFVATQEGCPLHSQVPVEVTVPDLVRPIVVRGTVVGRRGRSQRFAAGIYLKVPARELEKCRRFLGLELPRSGFEPARRARRVHCAVPIRFVAPAVDRGFQARNLSEVGAMVSCSKEIDPGARVRVAVTYRDEVLELDADVAWRSADGEHAGLQFVDASPEAVLRLRQWVSALVEERVAGTAAGAQPIVVADDEPDIQAFITTALTRHGFKVFHASTGDEALRVIQRLHPALVVMDILMPGMDGASVCRAMRADAELVDTPVIFLSALDREALHAVADESGATDYLCKPLHLSDLINLIGAYLQDAAPR